MSYYIAVSSLMGRVLINLDKEDWNGDQASTIG